eukprot:501122-Pelagomonas_calceolata.AAC.1
MSNDDHRRTAASGLAGASSLRTDMAHILECHCDSQKNTVLRKTALYKRTCQVVARNIVWARLCCSSELQLYPDKFQSYTAFPTPRWVPTT